MGFQYVTPITNIAASTAGSWATMDVSGVLTLPDTASGLMLRIRNTSGSTLALGLRKPGSTDNRINGIRTVMMTYAYVGLSALKTFEYYIGSTSLKFDIVGYTTNNVVFLTNGVDKTPAATGADTVVSCAAEAPGAIGLIFEHYTTAGYYFRVYKTGVTNVPGMAPTFGHDHFGFITGCDTSQQCTIRSQSTLIRHILIGYIVGDAYFPDTLPASFPAPAAGTGWRTSTIATPDGYNGNIEFLWPLSGSNHAVRPNGSTENLVYMTIGTGSAAIPFGTDRLFQAYVGNVSYTSTTYGYTQSGLVKRGRILRRPK